jgi:hypothetical protein
MFHRCSWDDIDAPWVWLFWSELPVVVVLVWLWRGWVWVRLPFRMVLKCEIGTAEGKPQVEQYGLDELAASAEAVLAGLGPLAAGLARLAVEAGRAVTLDAMEGLVVEQGRELLRGLVQLSLDAQAAGEVRLPEVTGADGVRRGRAERDHARPVVTRLGEVVVRRIGYRSGIRGVPSLFPRDAVLNLPPLGYSWGLQRLAEMFCRSGSYEQAHEFVLAATGVSIGKRQLEQIAAAAAAGVAAFYAVPAPGGPAQPPARPGQPAETDGDVLLPLGLSADGKGVAMRPESRRTRTKAPEARVKNFSTRPGTGEKGHKRIAEVACVFDVIPRPRTPEQVMASHHGGGDGQAGRKAQDKPAPQAVNRRYRVDIAADRSAAISWLFDEAGCRDPGHARDWIALVDGDNHQINLMEAEAAARGITRLTILIDLIHVMEYLWKAAWAFHAPRDPAIETWTITQALEILHGRAAAVITRITQLAAEHPPQHSEHAKNIKKTLSYLQAKLPYLDYPKALAAGWPVATGVIEGACRHLVKDRMGITGARWSTDGAQAILWLRVIHANHDTDAYWTWHLQQEHQRNHLSRYSSSDSFTLAA